MKVSTLFRLIITTSSCLLTALPAWSQDPSGALIIADQVEHKKTFLTAQKKTFRYEIHHPNASFIKVHFNQFHLSKGGYVKISASNTSEQVIYHSDTTGPLFARSIFGDKVVIEWHAGETPTQANISIDYYSAGREKDGAAFAVTDPNRPISTCGENERRDVACWTDTHPTEVGWSNAVARLLINGRSLCTAWRVGPDNHMMTNNHCVGSESELKNTEVWFNYQRTSCNGDLGNTLKVMGDQLLSTDYTLDYTLFTVKDFDKTTEFGSFGLDNAEPAKGMGIYIPQHGAGNPKELSIDSDVNNSGLCQIDLASANGRGTDTDTGYFCDTIGGSSGSPVVLSDSHKVIALHHFGGCENQGVKISRIWPEIASFFNNDLPQGNMGGDPTPPTPTYETLRIGQRINDININAKEQRIFVLPAAERTSDVRVTISSGTGDADLYIRSGELPTKTEYDCRPFRLGNNEYCNSNRQSDDLYIMLFGYSTTKGLTLSVEVQ